MAPIIVARDLFKCYAGFSPVLQGASLDVEAGELVAIMGPSGCGKSTMLHILGMLHSPDSGTLNILGKDVLSFTSKETAAFRRGNMGFVMQSSNLFEHSTVFENVEFPLIYEGVPPHERQARVIRALDLVKLSARVHYRSNRLSGGEQQRVAIARAMVNNPKVLLADEPTGALDAQTSKLIMENFRSLCHGGGVSMVMVTHDPKMADYCDSIYTLEEGILVCQRHTSPPAVDAEKQKQFFSGASENGGALVVDDISDTAHQVILDEANYLHSEHLLSRIYCLGGPSGIVNDDNNVLPRPIEKIGFWQSFCVLKAFGDFRGNPATKALFIDAWNLLTAEDKSFFQKMWIIGCAVLLGKQAINENVSFLYAVGQKSAVHVAWLASKISGIPFGFVPFGEAQGGCSHDLLKTEASFVANLSDRGALGETLKHFCLSKNSQ